MSEDEKKRGFEVKDRRVGAEDREDAKEEKPEAETRQAEPPKTVPKGEKPKEQPPMSPEMVFPAFLLSLNTSALIHMGLLPIPGTEQVEKNIQMAKQTIDLLRVIQEKTKGNLTKEESDLLENMLFELRMKYVELSKEN